MTNPAFLLRTFGKHFNEIFDWAGVNVHQVLVDGDWVKADVRILDVGAGQGKYRVVLADYEQVDACEVFTPYVEGNHLEELYDFTWNYDIRDLVDDDNDTLTGRYDIVIMGDVLEHLPRADAKTVLSRLNDLGVIQTIVVVPYQYPQGVEDGNEHQRHLQDDLTIELMAREYPELTLKRVQLSPSGVPFKGLYVRGGK